MAMNKKGIYFTLDSIIAGTIVIVIILLTSSFYIKEQPSVHLNYLSQDLIKTLSTLNVEEIDNEYINSLIADQTITNLDNTILEQIAEFWADDELVLANRTASNVTELWVSNVTGVGIWINNETIYNNNISLKKSLISTKKIISGIEKGQTSVSTRKNPPTLWGPVIVEVRVWQ